MTDPPDQAWFAFSPAERDPAAEQAAWERSWPKPVPGDGPLSRFGLMRYHVQVDDGDEPFFATDLVVPVIDAIPLFEMLGGSWPGIPAQWVMPPSGQWLGSPDHVEYGRAIVLDGSCGDAGCCGIVARISVLGGTVIWDEFHGNSAPDSSGRPRFEFSRDDYEAQLERLPQVPVTEWVDPDDDA